MIFQSLGSNYSFGDAIKLLFARGSEHDKETLVHWLEKHYGGSAILYDKGRNALSAALTGIKASHVAINATTCSVVVEAVTAAHGDIIYLDIEKDGHFSASTLNETLKKSPYLKAVVIQNTYGQPCDIAAIEDIAHEHNLILIEDLAHSLGQTYADGREVGTVGDIIMLSFGRDKIVDVVNGGALVVREPSLLKNIARPSQVRSKKAQTRDRIYPLLTWLARKSYGVIIGKLIIAGMYKFHLAEHSADGGIDTNHTLPSWQAKRLLSKLQMLDVNITHRRKINAIYAELLPNAIIAEQAFIRTPLYVNDRKKALQTLKSRGIYLADTWYDTPIGPKRKFIKMAYPLDVYPNAVQLSEHIINLPTHQAITPERARKLAVLLREVL